jgi:hypothetical protein
MKVVSAHRLGQSMAQWFAASAVAAIAVIMTCRVSAAEWVWPQEMTGQAGKLVVYQPQVELFTADRINARAAMSVQRKKQKEPVYGVFRFSARIATDRDTRTVTFENVKVENMKFSSSATDEDRQLAESLITQMATPSRMSMSFDRFLTMTSAVQREKTATDEINNDPPKILFVTTPTILVIVNGNPILRDIEGTAVRRVVNTPFVMLYNTSSKAYYLKGGNTWYSASAIKGPWTTVSAPPAPVASAALQMAEPDDPGIRQTALTKSKTVPDVIVATVPTELIVVDGEPEYSVIAGTDLLYMSNTPNDVFMDVKTKQYYVVLAGRWYRSSSLTNGAWTYVPSQKLPATFYQIPTSSEKGHVLTFIADTKQAEEAVMDAQIPQTAAIKRSEARADIAYDGVPTFEPVRGTSIDYAVNTSSQVLRVRDKYYACQQAVWYVSDSPTGPWAVSDYRPDEVDSIPPDSPVYNVKYVYVYDSTPDVVYVGYTPGYVGSYIYGDTVVYGTGYWYPGWYGTVYYPAPITWGLSPWYYAYYGEWGFGAGFVSGTFFGFAAGVIASPWWGWGGWWGPWWGYGGWWGWGGWWGHRHHGDGDHHRRDGDRHWGDRHGPRDSRHSQNLYNRPGNVAWNAQPSRAVPSGLRPGTTRDRSLGATTARSTRGSAFDTRSGGGRSPQLSPSQRGPRESAAVQRPGSAVDSRVTQRSSGLRQGRYDQSVTSRSMSRNNVYAGRDGDVYRRTDRGWEQRDRSAWTRPETIDRSGFYRNRPNLERDYTARSRGIERESTFRGSGSYQGRTMGSGGYPTSGFSRSASPGGSRSGGSYRSGGSGGTAYKGSHGSGGGSFRGGGSAGGPRGGRR